MRYNVVLETLSLALTLELDTVGLNLNLVFHTFDTRSFDWILERCLVVDTESFRIQTKAYF